MTWSDFFYLETRKKNLMVLNKHNGVTIFFLLIDQPTMRSSCRLIPAFIQGPAEECVFVCITGETGISSRALLTAGVAQLCQFLVVSWVDEARIRVSVHQRVNLELRLVECVRCRVHHVSVHNLPYSGIQAYLNTHTRNGNEYTLLVTWIPVTEYDPSKRIKVDVEAISLRDTFPAQWSILVFFFEEDMKGPRS